METNKQKQPKALIPLCATEAWERFGFYMIQSVLVLMITNYFHFSDSKALLITGTFGALIYIAPIIGGFYADKILGFRYTILMGCTLQMLGYIFIAMLHVFTTFFGLALVILGNGFLKSNIPSFLGEFFRANDNRRRAGFTYYYMGMNTGSFIGTVIVGYVQQSWGWHYCYVLAAIGMFLGIIIYLSNFRKFDSKGLPEPNSILFKKTAQFIGLTVLLCVVILAVCYTLLRHAGYGDIALTLIAIAVLCYLLWLCLYKFKGTSRRHLLALTILTLFAVVFWAMFFQMFSLLPLFIERTVDHNVLGFTIPTSAFLSLEPIFIILMGWPLAILWKRLHQLKKDPNIVLKFVLALLASGVGMKLLAIATDHPMSNGLIFPIVILLFFVLLTFGEMLLAPNFLSAVTELSPRHIIGMMMGVQYMAIGFGSLFSGILGQLAAMPKTTVKLSLPAMAHIYQHAFNVNAVICLICAVIILILMPLVTRLMKRA